MMKKWMKLMAVGLVSVGLLMTGCANDKNANSTSKAAKDKIVIGLDDNYPPIGFKDKDGNIIGSDIDMAKEVAKRLGMKVEFKSIDWAAKEVELKSGKVDAVWNGLTVTEERKKNILFTDPYQRGAQVIVVMADSPVKSQADIGGKKVGIQEGSAPDEMLKKDKALSDSFSQLKKYPDMVSVFMDLKAGRIDVAIIDEILARYYKTKENADFQVLPTNFEKETVAVGLALENKELQQKLNKILADMYKDGTTKGIMEKWFGSDMSIAPPSK